MKLEGCGFVTLESVHLPLSLPSELTRGSLIRLQQSDNGRVALGTFDELLQRQSTCEAVTGERFSQQQSHTTLKSTGKLLMFLFILKHNQWCPRLQSAVKVTF